MFWVVQPLQGQVNTSIASAQQNPSTAMDGDGNYVIVWESFGTDGDDYGIYGQLYHKGGAKNGNEFKVNYTTAKAQRYPDVAMGDEGDFVVTWMSEDQDGDSWGVYFQQYNASGTRQFSERRSNAPTSGVQRFPAIGMDNDENFIIVWSQTTTAGIYTIECERYHALGYSLASEFTVNSTSADFHGYPDVAMARTSGDFAVVWQSYGIDNSGNGVYGQRYNSSGTAQGGEFRANTEQSENQQEPSIAMDSTGNFVVVWSSYGQDASGYGVYGQRYTSSGTTNGSEFRVNSTTTNGQVAPAVSMTMEGSFVVVWAGFNSDGTRSKPYVSGYDNAGNAVITETLFTTADNFQLAPAVAVYDEYGNMAMAFQQGLKGGTAGDGDDFGIFATEQLSGDILYDPLVLYSTFPWSGRTGVDTTQNIMAGFDHSVLTSSLTAANFRVWGEYSGLISGSFSGGGSRAVTFDPSNDFFPGEKITVTLTTSLKTTDSKPLKEDYSFSFHAEERAMTNVPAAYNFNTLAKEVGAYAIYPVDLDNDGDMDVVGTTSIGSKVVWYQNDGSQNFSAHTITSSANGPTSVVATDLDNDGDVDILFSASNGGSIRWLENDGSQNFSSRGISSSLNTPEDLICIDLDADGDMDVLIGTSADNTVSWLRNDGSQSFTKIEICDTVSGVNSVYAEDLDRDGDIDILSASPNDNRIDWYENDGFENFTAHTITNTADGATDVVAVDLNGNGRIDVLSASKGDNMVSWYINDGSQSFTKKTVTNLLSDPVDIYAIDFDGDGDMDVCTASEGDDRIAWCENNGSQSFTLRTLTTNADGASSVYAADIDNNGYMDILSASVTDSTFAWYESETAFIWQGSNDTVWATSGNWKSGSTPTKDDNVVIPGSLFNYPFLAINTELNDIDIKSGAELTIKSGITLNLYGDLSSNSVANIDLGDGLLKFSGSTKQTVDGTITANVEVNNSKNVQLTDECTFKKVVFTNGLIDLGDHALTHSGVAVGATSDSYFKISGTGVLKAELSSTSDTFHVGFNPYTPVIVSCPTCTGSETFQLSVNDVFYDNPVSTTGANTANVVTHLWKVVTSATKDVDVTVQWNASDEAVGVGNDMFLGFWREGTNTNWADSAGTMMTKSGSDPYTLTRTIKSMNGTYHLGVGNSSSPLPVELTYFTAEWQEEGEKALLNWETSVEENNSHFEVQRSDDGIVWEMVGKAMGQGTTFSPTTYRFLDRSSSLTEDRQLSNIFYRLKQVDYSGQFEYSQIRSLSLAKSGVSNFSIHPNPATGNTMYASKKQTYEIFNGYGIHIKTCLETLEIDVTDLTNGSYFIKGADGHILFFIRS